MPEQEWVMEMINAILIEVFGAIADNERWKFHAALYIVILFLGTSIVPCFFVFVDTSRFLCGVRLILVSTNRSGDGRQLSSSHTTVHTVLNKEHTKDIQRT